MVVPGVKRWVEVQILNEIKRQSQENLKDINSKGLIHILPFPTFKNDPKSNYSLK